MLIWNNRSIYQKLPKKRVPKNIKSIKIIIKFIFLLLFIWFIYLLIKFFPVLIKQDLPILIITTAYNKPEYIELQYMGLKKFLKNEFKFVVFNDASNDVFQKQIEETCKLLNVDCYRVPQTIHHSPRPDWVNIENAWPCGLSSIIPAYRHSQSLRYAFEKFDYYKNGIICVIDADCFLIDDLNIKKFMGDDAITKL